jgi:hypothetical protein
VLTYLTHVESTYYRKFACVFLSLSLSLRTLPANDAWKKKNTYYNFSYLKKLFSLEWKRACRVPREALGSSPSLGGTTTGWPPRVSPTLGSCSPVCSDTSSHRKMVGASKGYEQVVASCCLRIRKRLAGSPPEGPQKKKFFSKKNFLRTHRRFPTSLHFQNFLEPPAIFLRILTHRFTEFLEYSVIS